MKLHKTFTNQEHKFIYIGFFYLNYYFVYATYAKQIMKGIPIEYFKIRNDYHFVSDNTLLTKQFIEENYPNAFTPRS